MPKFLPFHLFVLPSPLIAPTAFLLRSFWLIVVIGFCCGVEFGGADEAKQPVRPPSSRPNILFIAINDLNDWVGWLKGHPQVRTPYIDRLARRGTLFTNAHCQAPLCNPSRTSVLTGKRPSSTGVYGLSPWFRDAPELRNLVTLPEYFANHGYRTLATGRIFHSHFGLRADDKEFNVVGLKYDDGPLPNERLVPRPIDPVRKKPGRKNDWGPFPESDEQKGERLTYRYSGRDYRLTDVHGNVIQDVIA